MTTLLLTYDTSFQPENSINPHDFVLTQITEEYVHDDHQLDMTLLHLQNHEGKEANSTTPDYLISKSIDDIKRDNENRQKKTAAIQARKIIDQDNSLTQAEKDEAMKHFVEHGYVPKSCTKVSDSNTHITELHPPTEHLTEEDILNKINLTLKRPGGGLLQPPPSRLSSAISSSLKVACSYLVTFHFKPSNKS